jgi:hypothetical protein
MRIWGIELAAWSNMMSIWPSARIHKSKSLDAGEGECRRLLTSAPLDARLRSCRWRARSSRIGSLAPAQASREQPRPEAAAEAERQPFAAAVGAAARNMPPRPAPLESRSKPERPCATA